MEIYIKLKRKEDGSWEGKTEIDLKKLWYLEINKRLQLNRDDYFWGKFWGEWGADRTYPKPDLISKNENSTESGGPPL